MPSRKVDPKDFSAKLLPGFGDTCWAKRKPPDKKSKNVNMNFSFFKRAS